MRLTSGRLVTVRRGHVNDGGCFRDRGTFHHTRPRDALSGASSVRCSGWPAGAVAVRFHRCSGHRPGLSSPRSRGGIEAAHAPATSAGECLHEHDHGPPEHLDPRDPRSGRLRKVRPEVAFRSRQPPELLQGQGPSNRCSAPPVAMTRDRGFAPTPIAPGTSCRRTPPLTGLERRGERRLCRRRTHHEVSPSKGGLSAGHPRRYPASIRPRCLLSPAFASERARTESRSSRPWSRRLFHHVEAARGTPTCALDGSTDRAERVANHRLSKRRSAPE
jgi:hypothetical protein